MTRVDLLSLSRADLNTSEGFCRDGKVPTCSPVDRAGGPAAATSCRGGQMGSYGGLDVLAVAESELSRAGLTQRGLVGAAVCTLTVRVTKTNTSSSN